MTSRRAPKRKLSAAVAPEESPSTGYFSAIPRHNQYDVLKKLDFKDFVSFSKCSKETSEVAKNFRHILPLKAKHVHFKSNVIKVQYNSDFVFEGFMSFFDKPVRLQVELLEIYAPACYHMSLEDFCRNMRCTAQTILVHMDLDSSVFNTVINLLKVEKIVIARRTTISNMINPPESLKELEIRFGANMEEAAFLHLAPAKVSAYFWADLTLSVINRLLMQWYQGLRRIEKLTIGLLPKVHEDILEYLEHTTFSKKEILKLMKAAQKKDAPYLIYTLRRPDGKHLFVAISKKYKDYRLFASESDSNELKEWLHSVEWQSLDSIE